MNETPSQRVVNEWAMENGIGVDGFAVVWVSTYACSDCDLTKEYTGCGHCGHPGGLGPSGDGSVPPGLCRGGTDLCRASKEVSERRVRLDFVDRRDALHADLQRRLGEALDAASAG